MPRRKKDSADLLQDFQVHAQWAASNLDVLRSRSGGSFKGKLRASQSKDESRIYYWLHRHACDLETGSLLAQQLAIVDAFVTKSEDALLQEYQAHAAPVHAASAADAAVEAGAHAGACSWLPKLLATCTFEASLPATAPAPAALDAEAPVEAADAAGEDGASAIIPRL